jgi:hypothetical protein
MPHQILLEANKLLLPDGEINQAKMCPPSKEVFTKTAMKIESRNPSCYVLAAKRRSTVPKNDRDTGSLTKIIAPLV